MHGKKVNLFLITVIILCLRKFEYPEFFTPYSSVFMELSLNHKVFFIFCFIVLGVGLSSMRAFSQDTSLPSDLTEGIQTVIITMESYSFTPQTLTTEVGKPIEFILKNESFLIPHNFLLDSPDGARLVESNVVSGEHAIVHFTPTQIGVYVFYCDEQFLFFPKHREEGMEGTLTVQ